MPRPLSSAVLSAINADVVNHFFAIEVGIIDQNDAEQTIRLWTGLGDKTIDNQVYTGTGDMLSMSDTDEGQDLGMNGITIGLAMNSDFLSNFTNKEYQGKDVKVKLVFTDDSNTVLLGTMEYFDGFTDTISYRQSGDTAVLSLKAENKLIKLTKSANLRYTAEDQKRYFPNDQSFDNKRITGSKPNMGA